MVRLLLLTALLAAPLTAAADAVPAPANAAPAPAIQLATLPTTPAATVQPAAAQLTASGSPIDPEPVQGESAGFLLFKTLVVLGVVVAFIYLTLNVGARKLLRLNGPGNALVKVIDRVPLDPKKSLYVVHVAGEFMLVGAAEQGMSLLSKLDAEAVQKLLTERAQAKPQSKFLERLNALARPGKTP